MAIVGSRLWYHPRWFARHVPDPDLEGQRLEDEFTAGQLAPVGTSAREGLCRSASRIDLEACT
jgi:hypothetical protein